MINYVNKKYNDMLYDSKPVKFSDFMSNKYNIVHKKLYEQALNKYIIEWIEIRKVFKNYNEIFNINLMKSEDQKLISSINIDDKKYAFKKDINKDKVFNVDSIEDFKKNSYILEIPANEYWQPSRCCIITKFKDKSSPNLRWTVDLTPYWNNYQAKENKKIENIKLTNENFNDSEIIKFNYVTGKATLYSENANKEYDVDFDYLDGNTNKVSESMMLKETFGYKINNN